MRRKKSNNRNGRLANTSEKNFHKWLSEQSCAWCGNPGPSIVDHCRGSTFSNNKVHIGHWFCLPQCVTCDTQKTIHGKRLGNESKAWAFIANAYEVERMDATAIPDDVFLSIQAWNK